MDDDQTRPPAAPDGDAEPGEGGKRKRGPHPDAGKYVVLAAAPVAQETQEGDDAPRDPLPGAFKPVTGAIAAEGQREAKKAAVEGSEELRSAVAADGVFLVAVPAMSWQPSLVKAEQPPPIMRGL